ncbi:hypothetical protein BDZ91DRAFT_709798 [Kalaharituber pfeilii]|nr:hypothetical protein BDZ91DRAFT_709798 [Kalaharituber pfeilii]
MRICVLQSSYENTDNIIGDVDKDYMDPSHYTDEHTFEHRWLLKATAKEQIDTIVAEGFDLYINALWGQHEDSIAGIDAVKYLENKNVPFVGCPSRIQERTKLDFYRDAQKAGVRVPETGIGKCKFPVFVKPAKCCASMYLDEKSVCYTQEELDTQLAILNEKLEAGRKIARENAEQAPPPDEVDIVVQEYIDGLDFSCVIIEMMDTPIALAPTLYRYPSSLQNSKTPFLTFGVKFHPELREVPLLRSENPKLFDELQALAIASWKANKMEGGSWGNVDMRRRASDGKLFAIEVNPMPAVFIPGEHKFEDAVIETFPGGHPGLINILIETALTRHHGNSSVPAQVATSFDVFAPTYEVSAQANGMTTRYSQIHSTWDFSGSVLDVACGTGIFPRSLRGMPSSSKDPRKGTVFTGVDVSKGMLEVAQEDPQGPLYAEAHVGPMQEILPRLTGPYDHVVCLLALQFVSPTLLSLVLARFFQLAQKSVTFTADEMTEDYNQGLRDLGRPWMVGWNHAERVVKFIKHLPPGWKFVEDHGIKMDWVSPHVGHAIKVPLYRFERVDA